MPLRNLIDKKYIFGFLSGLFFSILMVYLVNFGSRDSAEITSLTPTPQPSEAPAYITMTINDTEYGYTKRDIYPPDDDTVALYHTSSSYWNLLHIKDKNLVVLVPSNWNHTEIEYLDDSQGDVFSASFIGRGQGSGTELFDGVSITLSEHVDLKTTNLESQLRAAVNQFAQYMVKETYGTTQYQVVQECGHGCIERYYFTFENRVYSIDIFRKFQDTRFQQIVDEDIETILGSVTKYTSNK